MLLKKLKRGTAPGTNGISPDCLIDYSHWWILMLAALFTSQDTSRKFHSGMG